MKLKNLFKHKNLVDAQDDNTDTKNSNTEEISISQKDNSAVVAISSESEQEKSVIENDLKEDDRKIQTIPLSEEEVNNLIENGYDQAKITAKKTYVIEKILIGYVDSTDPTNPGKKPVKVKRVAELKAASLMHALNMIGWDKKNVTVANVIDDSQCDIEIRVNGKTIGKLDISNRPEFTKLSGGQQNVEKHTIEEIAKNNDCVKEYLLSRSVEVTKIIYVPNHYVNLVVKKVKHLADCQCCLENTEIKKGD